MYRITATGDLHVSKCQDLNRAVIHVDEGVSVQSEDLVERSELNGARHPDLIENIVTYMARSNTSPLSIAVSPVVIPVVIGTPLSPAAATPRRGCSAGAS